MKKLTVLCLLAGIVFFFLLGTAQADVNDFKIEKFKADYYIDNLKSGGSMTTIEQIDVTFTDQNHGILRAIPSKYRGFDTKINGISVELDGQNEPYSTYKENGNLVLKIGDKDKTITGKHSYKIRYLQERIINFNEGKPSFYWDVNGDQWAQSFGQVEANVYVKGARLDALKSNCFTGFQGSQEKNCSISESQGALAIKTTQVSGPNQNLSIEILIEGVPFKQPSITDKIIDNWVTITGLSAGIGVALTGFIMWLRFGRDYSGRGVIVPAYEAPAGLSPAEIGLLADYKTDGRDVSATLIDLAVRGYVRLHDDSKKILFFKSRHFRLELLKSNYAALKEHESLLLNAIFSTKRTGEIVELNNLNKTTMSNALTEIRSGLEKDLTEKYGLFEKRAKKQQTLLGVSGVIIAVAAAFVPLNIGFDIGLIGGGAILVLFAVIMPRRSHAGVEMYEQIKGLELYMKTAEADRMKMTQSVDRPYTEPTKTVELFEKLLPYAVALGVEKSWAKQFSDVLSGDVDWYAGSNVSSFNAGYLANSIGHATSSFSQSFESSSGSSGGSGGGGGGGGGGGW